MMSEYGSDPTFTLENIYLEKIRSLNKRFNLKLNEKKSQFYLGRVTITGEAEMAGMLQLISGLTSKTISLFISTL